MGRRLVHLLDLAVPLLAAAVVVVGGVLRGGAGERPLALALGLLAAATLAARRRAPLAVLAVSAGLVLVLMHVDAAAGATAVIVPAIALYSFALGHRRAHQLLAAAVGVLAILGADALFGGASSSMSRALGHLALLALPLLAAEALRNRRSYVSLLREQLALAERTREQEAQRRAEQERMRIARELHDVVAHTLTTINVQAGVAGYLLDGEPRHARSALQTIEDASRDALNELRAVLGILRDRDATEAPLAPPPGVQTLAGLVERARESGLDVRLDVRGDPPDHVPDAVGLAAFRIVQESLTNARRHAAGAPVRVGLDYAADGVCVVVENGPRRAGGGRAGARLEDPRVPAGADGTEVGAPRGKAVVRAAGVGILGMTERATAIGGTLRAAPVAGGFRVDAELPYRAPA